MLDTLCSEVVWRVPATHSIRQFPLHFPAHAQKPDFVFRRNGPSPFKSAGGGSVQSTTGSRGVRISGSNAGYTMFPCRASPCAITFQLDSTLRYCWNLTFAFTWPYLGKRRRVEKWPARFPSPIFDLQFRLTITAAYWLNDIFLFIFFYQDVLGSVIDAATRYGPECPGIESRWGGEIFSTRLNRPWGTPNFP